MEQGPGKFELILKHEIEDRKLPSVVGAVFAPKWKTALQQSSHLWD
jgi:hypothetical protein